VQGVSAASLSLEAALLMIKAGDVERGTDVLVKIREELAGEADALRRLMAGLRPPVLEERGLIPALRETLSRFGIETGVVTSFEGELKRTVPRDVETLAYRLVPPSRTAAVRIYAAAIARDPAVARYLPWTKAAVLTVFALGLSADLAGSAFLLATLLGIACAVGATLLIARLLRRA